MDIGPDRTRVGLVPFSSDVLLDKVFDLASSTTQGEVLSAVENLEQGDPFSGEEFMMCLKTG